MHPSLTIDQVQALYAQQHNTWVNAVYRITDSYSRAHKGTQPDDPLATYENRMIESVPGLQIVESVSCDHQCFGIIYFTGSRYVFVTGQGCDSEYIQNMVIQEYGLALEVPDDVQLPTS